MIPPRWLEWAREIQALAQTGDHYVLKDYQHQKNHRLLEIAAEIVSEHSGLNYSTAFVWLPQYYLELQICQSSIRS